MVDITIPSSYYLMIDDLVLSSICYTMRVTWWAPPLSKPPSKEKFHPMIYSYNFNGGRIVYGVYRSVGGNLTSRGDNLSTNTAAHFFAF